MAGTPKLPRMIYGAEDLGEPAYAVLRNDSNDPDNSVFMVGATWNGQARPPIGMFPVQYPRERRQDHAIAPLYPQWLCPCLRGDKGWQWAWRTRCRTCHAPKNFHYPVVPPGSLRAIPLEDGSVFGAEPAGAEVVAAAVAQPRPTRTIPGWRTGRGPVEFVPVDEAVVESDEVVAAAVAQPAVGWVWNASGRFWRLPEAGEGNRDETPGVAAGTTETFGSLLSYTIRQRVEHCARTARGPVFHPSYELAPVDEAVVESDEPDLDATSGADGEAGTDTPTGPAEWRGRGLDKRSVFARLARGLDGVVPADDAVVELDEPDLDVTSGADVVAVTDTATGPVEWKGRGRHDGPPLDDYDHPLPRSTVLPSDEYESKLARRGEMSVEDRLLRQAQYIKVAEQRRAAREARDELFRGGLGVVVGGASSSAAAKPAGASHGDGGVGNGKGAGPMRPWPKTDLFGASQLYARLLRAAPVPGQAAQEAPPPPPAKQATQAAPPPPPARQATQEVPPTSPPARPAAQPPGRAQDSKDAEPAPKTLGLSPANPPLPPKGRSGKAKIGASTTAKAPSGPHCPPPRRPVPLAEEDEEEEEGVDDEYRPAGGVVSSFVVALQQAVKDVEPVASAKKKI